MGCVVSILPCCHHYLWHIIRLHVLLCCILLDGFVIVKRYIHPWVVW